MYEEEPMLRRILLIVLWFIIIVTILWSIVWVIFFRQNQTKSTKTSKPTQHTRTVFSGQAARKPTPNNSASNSTSTPGDTSNRTGQLPSTLVNTGAGNIVVPFSVATTVGSVMYYMRLRKRMSR